MKFYSIILSSPPVVSFSGPQNLVTTEENETTIGGLKQLEDMGNFPPIVSIVIVKLKHVGEIRDLRHSSSIKNVKRKTINVNYTPNLLLPRCFLLFLTLKM